jgi:ankyrin repeat protein
MTDATAIFRAVGDPDLKRLVALLDAGADPNSVNPDVGNTPLYNACFGDHLDAVRLLLARGADPNKRIVYRSPVDGRVEEGVVALMFARSAEVALALLGAGADPNAQDAAGRTALMRAAVGGTPEQVTVLIVAGANVTARDKKGATAADAVKARLQWLKDFHSSLKENEARARKTELESILATLGGEGTICGLAQQIAGGERQQE